MGRGGLLPVRMPWRLKRSPDEADGSRMDSEIRAAWRRAGLKLAIGSIAIAAVIGIRIVVVTPADPAADGSFEEAPAGAGLFSEGRVSESSETGETRPGETSPAETRDGAPGGNDLPSEQEGSLGSRIGALGQTVQESLTGAAPKPREGDRIVACRLRGVAQYMRADDCELRGGSVFGAKR